MAIHNRETEALYLQMLEELTELEASVNPQAQLWHQAVKLLNAMDIDLAALKAAQACGPGLLDDHLADFVLNAISDQAVVNNISGPGIEAMWTRAAEFGRHDLAYNAANKLMDSAQTPSQYKLAARYYQRAIQNTPNVSVKASAITNYACIIRDGLITGHKDWLGAVALYEQAAQLQLLTAMYNAGNVLLWLVEGGEHHYADRAAEWFKKVIEYVATGQPTVDIGGEDLRRDMAMRANLRLASMVVFRFIKGADPEAAIGVVAPYLATNDYARWLVKKVYEYRLISSYVEPGHSAADNWAAILQLNGWLLKSSTPFDNGIIGGVEAKGHVLEFQQEEGESLTLVVIDAFTHPQFDALEVLKMLGSGLSTEMNCPIFMAGSKGFFVDVDGQNFSILHAAVADEFSLVPIWPGMSISDVLHALGEPVNRRFSDSRTDECNCIPILVNALDEGLHLDGKGIPCAIWLGSENELRFPILRAVEPQRQGLKISLSRKELQSALNQNLASRPSR